MAGTGASSYNGFAISRTLDAAECYNGVVPTSGGNIFIRPDSYGGYGGNNVQVGAPNAAGNRFAGLFVRGLDIGEGGTLTTTDAETGRGIAMVGATPKWAAAQSTSVSDNYPRGGILIGIRGDGAETLSDSRRIQIINESKFGRVEILAQPGTAGVTDSTINIIQGRGVNTSANPGIMIAGARQLDLMSTTENVTIQAQAAGSSFAVNVGSEA